MDLELNTFEFGIITKTYATRNKTADPNNGNNRREGMGDGGRRTGDKKVGKQACRSAGRNFLGKRACVFEEKLPRPKQRGSTPEVVKECGHSFQRNERGTSVGWDKW
jgi:hypothetical protein